MRYFLLGFAIVVLLIVSLAGFRGDFSRRPPLEVFPDMDRQFKLRPQTQFGFFGDNLSSRLPVEGTVSRGVQYEVNEFSTGLITGTTNWIENIPVPVTLDLLKRGQQRYNISCGICHGETGDGRGITTQYGMVAVANFHDARTINMTDGEIFHVITHGRNLMGAYGPVLEVEDRWAIIAYLRALQRSHLGTLDEVPEDQRAKFER